MVVAIIGLLAAIAIPVYSAFIIQSKLVEGIDLADSCRVLIDTYAAGNNDMTGAAGNAVCDTTQLTSSHFTIQPIIVQSSTIVIIPIQLSPTFGGVLSNAQFGWWKDYSQPAGRWTCGGTPYVNTTPILNEALPPNCRG